MRDKVIAWAMALAVTAFVMWSVTRLAFGEVGYLPTVITTLQPDMEPERANRLAVVFNEAADWYNIEPRLLVAIAFRESSLREDVERHQRRGKLGEGGLMQVHGAALRVRPADCTRELIGARCQVMTGAAWLSEARRQCGGSMWRWVGAYGTGTCPSERRARTMSSVKVARRHYLRIGGRWEI